MVEFFIRFRRYLTGRSLIGLTFLGLLLMLSALSNIALESGGYLEQEYRQVFEQRGQRLRYLDQMLSINNERQIALRNVVSLHDPFDRDDASIRHAELAAQFISVRDQYKQLATGPRDVTFMHLLQSQLLEIYQAQKLVLEFALDEQTKSADIELQTVIPQMELARDMLQAQLIREQLGVQTAYASAQDRSFESRWYILVLFTSSIAMGGLAMLLVLRQHTSQQKALQRLAAVAEHSPEIILTLDSKGQPTYINPAAKKVLELIAEPHIDISALIPDDIGTVVTRCLATHQVVRNIEHQVDGRKWIISIQPVGWQPLVHCFYTDISEFSRVSVEQQQLQEKAHVTLHSISDAVITTDADGKINYLNPSAAELTGLDPESAIGQKLVDSFHTVSESTRDVLEDPSEICLRHQNTVELPDHAVLLRGEEEVAITQAISPIRDSEGHIIGTVLVFHDVSQERRLRHQLSYQASHDALTGLVNRREMEVRIESALIDAGMGVAVHALLYMDLDQFKIVNDTCGHVAGDELLRQLAVVLVEQGQLRETDTLARLGGDEFGVLLLNCPVEQASTIADRLRQTVKEFRFGWENISFEIGVSIGLVAITEDTQSMSSVLSAADVACYAAKESGRNCVHLYEADDSESAQRHNEIQLVTQIRSAIDEDRFFLEYQRILPLAEDIQGQQHFEVLIRMHNEEGGIVPPNAFIPAAERYDLMTAVDRWVIKHVFANFQSIVKASNDSDLKVSINLSGQSLCDNQCYAFIMQQQEEYAVPPSGICFEITETAAIANLGSAIAFMKLLREAGYSFSLDDFGSGLSSFAYLKNLPVDYLKIDGSFVSDIIDDPIDLAMVEAINQIGHVMGIRTIAESAENTSILEKLKMVGVDYAQGFGIERPRDIGEIFPDLHKQDEPKAAS